ncbi:MAG: hypothetical protein N2C14_30860, partial [Planctomycetales bacterium]
IRETYNVTPEARVHAEEIASGKRDPRTLKDVSKKRARELYGAWIDKAIDDPQARLAKAMWEHQPAESPLRLVRATLVAGDVQQRMRAMDLLQHLRDETHRDEAIQLCRYCLKRANRSGENVLSHKAKATLAVFLSLSTQQPGD